MGRGQIGKKFLELRPFHHFFHFKKLFQQLIDFGNRSAASSRDASTAAAAYDFRIFPLVYSHGIDDGFEIDDFFVINAQIGDIFEHPSRGQHVEKLGY